MNTIRFEHVSKSYGKTEVIKDLNLEIPSGQRVILLGPSGCGKTTTLRMIAGLEEITGGDLYMGESRVNDVESGDRNVAMVFQNYALFPHMTVYKKYCLWSVYKLRTYKVLELKEYKIVCPRSGGQRQRVALARAAVQKCPVFSSGWFLSNLDAQLRAQTRKELVKLHEMNHPTFVYVTHDQIEAMTIGQKVVLMYGGNIQMADTPYNIYHRPINVFTARFIGSPPMNILKVRLTEGKLKIGHDLVELEDDWLALLTRTGKDEFYLGIRPEEVLLSHRDDGNCVQIAVKYAENYGNRLGIYFDIEEAECVASVEIGQGLGSSSQVFWSLKPSKLSFFDVETEKNIGYPEKYQKQENETLLHAEQLLHLQGA